MAKGTKPIIDRVGEKYGRLTVTSFNERKNGRTYWNVKCDCGNTDIARADKLTTGGKKSCGCLWAEKREDNLLKLTPGMLGYHSTQQRY